MVERERLLTSYTHEQEDRMNPGYVARGSIVGFTCERCGAAVSLIDGDRQRHDEWHEETEDVLSILVAKLDSERIPWEEVKAKVEARKRG